MFGKIKCTIGNNVAEYLEKSITILKNEKRRTNNIFYCRNGVYNMNDFNTLGVMIDCSRNAVMKASEVKKFALNLSKMGYNALLLYTEDTYEIKDEPFFGHLRGRYTHEELADIDSYCKSLGIEVIPCIQTLAHLNCMFKWESVYDGIRDIDDVLLIDEENTYKLIEKMFAQISRTFSSKRIHIGMDEAFSVGLGKHLALHGYEERYNLIVRHLDRVCKIAAKYGLETMIWSDMFVKLGLSVGDYYAIDSEKAKKPDADIPKNVSLVYWDYYSDDYDHYMQLIKVNKMFGRNVVFAGGVWTWRGFAPDNAFSLKVAAPAIRACRDSQVKDVIFTMWGDDGGECPKNAVLPSLFYISQLSKGNENMEDIKKKFLDMFGFPFDSMLLLDGLDTPGDIKNDNPSKYMLYNDPFTGLNDHHCSSEHRAYYRELTKKLKNAECSDEYRYLFDSGEKLSAVLEYKCDLGLRTRNLYQSCDKEGLKKLINEDYPLVIDRLKEFYTAFKVQWFKENNPHGFDVQDIRIGGLLMRLESCKDRLGLYLEGKIDSIPELEEKTLNGEVDKHWARCVSPNVISHIV